MIGNATLPVEYAGHNHLAILDCGAGIAIAKKGVWERWGKPYLKQTNIKLQMADGNIKFPIGMLEKVLLTSSGVQFEHTIAVVDFEEDPSYDIILGWPFMRQLSVIQDWGTNHIYLQQKEDVTYINWEDHS